MIRVRITELKYVGPFLVRRAKGAQKSRKKKGYHTIWDKFAQLSWEQIFFRSDPQVAAKGDLLGFWPVLGRGHLEKFRARVKNGKTRFPGARGTFGGKNRPPHKFLGKIAHLFYILRFDRPGPRGGKSQNTGDLVVFWVWTKRNFTGKRQMRKSAPWALGEKKVSIGT